MFGIRQVGAPIRKPENGRADRRLTVVFLGLTVAVLVSAAIFGPTFPMIDSAFFEFIGRSISRGRHLYVDVWDNKLPSIYLINALYWSLFGGHFRLHLVFETVVAAITVGLFAAIARRLAITYWAPLTFAYALLHLFVGGPPNQTEHYATPLVLASVLLVLRGRPVLGAVPLVLASTFWVPSILAAGIPIVTYLGRAKRLGFILTTLGVGAAVVSAFVLYYGVTTSVELVHSWVAYEAGNYAHANYQPERHAYAAAPLAPSFYTRGLGALIAIALTFWGPALEPHRARRLALTWTTATLAIVASLGKVSPHYFIPMYPPFVLLIGTLPLGIRALRARWVFAIPAGVLSLVTIRYALEINRPDLPTIAAIRYTGAAIRATFGPGVLAVLPWEMYLPADAFPPGRFFLARVVKFARDNDRWAKPPDVYVDARDHHFNRLPPPSDLAIVCRGEQTGPFLVYARRPIVSLSCQSVHEEKAATSQRRGFPSRDRSASRD